MWCVLLLTLGACQSIPAVRSAGGPESEEVTPEVGDISADPVADTALPDDPVADTGIPDEPIADTGIPESPVADTALPESPVADTGIPDEPIADTGIPESPVADTELPDDPVADTALPDNPVADTSIPESPVADTDLSDDPVADTDLPDEPIADTALPDEPIADTALPDDPVADTGIPESPVVDTDLPDDPVVDTDLPDDPVADTALPESPIADTALPDDPVADTALPDDPVADTALPDDPVADTALPDDPVADIGLSDTPIADTGLSESPVAGTSIPDDPIADTTINVAEQIASVLLPAREQEPLLQRRPEPLESLAIDGSDDALLQRVAVLQANGYRREALELLRASFPPSENNPAINGVAARLANSLGEYQSATEYWRVNLTAPPPYNSEARAGLLRVALQRGDLEGALNRVQEVFLNGETPPFDALIQLAEYSVAQGDYRYAGRLYQSAESQYPEAPQRDRLLWGLGQLEERDPERRNMSTALGYYRRVMQGYPLSEYWEPARVRSSYLRRHFFDIR